MFLGGRPSPHVHSMHPDPGEPLAWRFRYPPQSHALNPVKKNIDGVALCKHEVSPWLPKRTARSAPASFSPQSRKLPPVAAQNFQTAYHLKIDCEQRQTPLLVSPVALIKLHRRARSRVAWTEFGSVGEGRRNVCETN